MALEYLWAENTQINLLKAGKRNWLV